MLTGSEAHLKSHSTQEHSPKPPFENGKVSLLKADCIRSPLISACLSKLPGFLEALEDPKQIRTTRNAASTSNDVASASHKLRYAAYEQAQPVTSLRSRRPLSPLGSVRSESISDRGGQRQATSQNTTEALNMSLAAVSLGLDMPSANSVPNVGFFVLRLIGYFVVLSML